MPITSHPSSTASRCWLIVVVSLIALLSLSSSSSFEFDNHYLKNMAFRVRNGHAVVVSASSSSSLITSATAHSYLGGGIGRSRMLSPSSSLSWSKNGAGSASRGSNDHGQLLNRQASYTRRTENAPAAAAFVTSSRPSPSWQRVARKDRATITTSTTIASPSMITQQNQFSTLAIMNPSESIMPSYTSSLFATIPTTDEILDFGDLDYFNNEESSSASAVIHKSNEEEETSDGGDNVHIGDHVGSHSSNNNNVAVEAENTHGNEIESNPLQGGNTNHNNNNNENDNGSQNNNSKMKKQLYDHNSNADENIIVKSKPKEGGKWNPADPLAWSETFGRRSPADAERLASLVRLRDGDEGYFPVEGDPSLVPEGVTVVRTVEQARIVLEALAKSKLEEPDRIHACDTEVMDIDLKKVGPVGHGYVTCLSVYSGPDFDYGLDGLGPGTMLWVDNLDDACGVMMEFREWLEDESVLKAWHNYGFDRHVLYNEGIDVKGLGGDTMHMARLSDTGRMKYSLESLTEDLLGQRKVPMKEIFGEARLRKDGTPGALVDLPPMERLQRDPKYRHDWIMYSAFDAKSTYNLYQHLKEKLVNMAWIDGYNLMEYYHMHMRPFGALLTDLERRGILVATDYLADVEVQARKDRVEHVATFKRWAAGEIGPDGLAMNLASSVQLSTFLFGGAANAKTQECTEAVRVFKTPRADVPDEAMEAYRERDAALKEQKEADAALLENGEGGESSSEENVPEEDEFDQMKAAELKLLCKEYKLKVSGKKAELQQRLRGHFQLMNDPSASPNGVANSAIDDYQSMKVNDLRDACAARSLPSAGKTKAALIKELREDDSSVREISAEYMTNPSSADASATYRKISELLEEAASAASGENDLLKTILADLRAKNAEEPKYVDVKITSLGLTPDKFTAGGAPSATADVLRKLAGDPFADPPQYGTAYDHFGKGKKGHDACVAFYSLTAIGSIDTMIANFLTSLQTLADSEKRVHGSLNINTETGRLSSRKPNLQNQPALEKDKYKIRQASIASPGNKLIVTDYGQLELRLLASMTDCTSMIEAFEAGGDFHSRTALGMFKYIQDAVENGEVLLEWDYSNGDPPKPMLKDQYASERRKAKTLNFSIAYGKTAHGLSADWGVSTKEAEEMLQAWYDSRPEVEKWQKDTKAVAKKHGLTRTLMGRYRHLPHAMEGSSMKALGHALRASINTPIQGGAADVAMMAMLKINNSPLLKKLGWILLMQVHDEVMLEGPEETAEEAFEEVLKCMQEPWVLGLEKTKVPLLVDGSCAYNNWYDAK